MWFCLLWHFDPVFSGLSQKGESVWKRFFLSKSINAFINTSLSIYLLNKHHTKECIEFPKYPKLYFELGIKSKPSVQGPQHSKTRKTKKPNVLTAVYRSRNVQVCQQACRKGIILIKLSPPPIIGQPGGKSFPFSASVDTEQAVCKKLFADSWLWALAGVLESLYCEDYNYYNYNKNPL